MLEDDSFGFKVFLDLFRLLRHVAGLDGHGAFERKRLGKDTWHAAKEESTFGKDSLLGLGRLMGDLVAYFLEVRVSRLGFDKHVEEFLGVRRRKLSFSAVDEALRTGVK